ncbi:hypothetical protein D9M69_612420 [compost metagenome]
MRGFSFFPDQVNVYRGIQFAQNNIDVVCAHAGRYDAYSFAVFYTRMGHNFPLLSGEFHVIKKGGNYGHPVWIPYQKYGLANVLRPQVNMVKAAVRVQDQF